MKISACMIAFNAESVMPPGMLEACIGQISKIAHEVIICEGATVARTGRFDGDGAAFTRTGHSTDQTREVLARLSCFNSKIKLISGRGFWDGKTAMANATAEAATGDYIFWVDADEFYTDSDLIKIVQWLEAERPDAVHFYANHFWGGFKDCITDQTGQGWGNNIPWMRIFRRVDGGKWRSHEPPDYAGMNNKVITRDETLRRGVRLFHYGYACRAQAEFKQKFYRNPVYLDLWDRWQRDHSTELINGARTVPFAGTHPEAVTKLLAQ